MDKVGSKGPRRRKTRAQTLSAIITLQQRIIEAGLNLEAVMATVVREIPELSSVSDGAVIELRDGDDMVYRAASGTAATAIGLRLPMAGSLSGACVLQGTPLYAADCATDDRVNNGACARLEIRSMACYPLLANGKCVGVCKAFSAKKDAYGKDDLAVIESVTSLVAQCIAHSKEHAAVLEASTRDALTGLRNRRAFDEDYSRAIALARRTGSPLTLAVIDMNGFKILNDTLGHHFGDTALANVGSILASLVRASDSAYRVGGDEFALLLSGTASEGAELVAKRARASVRQIVIKGMPLDVSVGTATLLDEDTPRSLYERADSAMYEVKLRRKRELARTAVGHVTSATAQ